MTANGLVFQQLDQRRYYLDTVAENSTRLARVAIRFDSTGFGESYTKHAVTLGVIFVEEPTISTGVALTSGRLVANQYPNVCSGVYKWQRNSQGYYTGAYLFFVVDSAGGDYRLRHSLVFEATAMKLNGKNAEFA